MNGVHGVPIRPDIYISHHLFEVGSVEEPKRRRKRKKNCNAHSCGFITYIQQHFGLTVSVSPHKNKGKPFFFSRLDQAVPYTRIQIQNSIIECPMHFLWSFHSLNRTFFVNFLTMNDENGCI